MADLPSLRALYDRVCKADGPDRELDSDLFALSQGGRIHYYDAGAKNYVWEKPIGGMWIRDVKSASSTPAYTASLDAITALIERELPGQWNALMDRAIQQMWTDHRAVVDGWKLRIDLFPKYLTAAFLAACIAREAENAD